MPNFEVNISFEATGPEVNRNLPGIIFLHEVGFCKETWKPCLRTIANNTGRMVVTYDARNHGSSGWTHNFTYSSMMEDLKNIMEFLHMPKAVLVGHGMGGKTAIDFSLKYPEKVERLIVEDMTLKFQPEGEKGFCFKYIELLGDSLRQIPADVKDLENAKEFLASYIHPRIPEEYKSDHPKAFTKDMMPLEIDKESGKFEWKTHLGLIEEGVFNGFQTEPEGGFRVFKYEGEYNGPALFLYGSKSPYRINNDRDFILNRMKNAAFKCMEGGGHLLHTDLPEQFCDEVIRFLNDN